MNVKEVDFWINLYSSVKDVWLFILIPVIFSILKLLNKNDLYQTKNIENIKMILKNIGLFILMTIAALIYLLGMISISLNAYSKKEILKDIFTWEDIGSFIILIIIYAMLFPIVTIPFLGERRSKKYFIEKNNNDIVEREIIDRVYINGKDKLILKADESLQIEKNITNIDNLTFKIQDKKAWLTIKDIQNTFSKIKNKSKKTRVSLFIFIFIVPTAYLVWNVPSIIDMFTKLQKWTDIFSYIGLLTLPAILIIELYYVIYIAYCSLFTRSIIRVLKDRFSKTKK